jgi:hypothetical protein
MSVHLIKLCVGCDTVEELAEWRRLEHRAGQPWIMRTRQTPKRAVELIAGGSLFRVFKGFVLCRQRILAVDTVGAGVATRCEVTLDPELILTVPTPRRAFQGWRYLDPHEAPVDLRGFGEDAAPPELVKRLREIGAW